MRYRIFLIAAFLTVWVIAAINPLQRDHWLLENLLIFIAVPLIVLLSWYFKFSNISYTLITMFMILHVIGSHYTYVEVPFGFWLQDLLKADRNMYDRLVHFSFGLLLAYPVREVFLRIVTVKGIWGFYLPLDVTLSLSAIYEIIEWLAASIIDPAAGIAFLGTQGDVWDAQRDMAAAGLGAMLAMLLLAGFNIKLNPHFWREIAGSLRIPKGDKPLGEVKLEEWFQKKKGKFRGLKRKGKSPKGGQG